MNLPALPAFEIVVGLTALQRLGELWHSRQNLERLSAASRPADSRGNWIALVTVQVLWLAGTALEPALAGRVASASYFWVGLVLFLTGESLRVWCILTLGHSWNARARVDPGLSVVSHGPYRWIRHPNYLGVFLELVGLPLAGGAWWTLFLVLPPHAWIFARRIRGEDRLLFALPGYAEAMRGKGALWPRFSRARRGHG